MDSILYNKIGKPQIKISLLRISSERKVHFCNESKCASKNFIQFTFMLISTHLLDTNTTLRYLALLPSVAHCYQIS